MVSKFLKSWTFRFWEKMERSGLQREANWSPEKQAKFVSGLQISANTALVVVNYFCKDPRIETFQTK